ncbi:MAG TPA: ABC transporter ATP-binding protein [Paenibacillus sp.]|jgi:ABC-2 type transport system ATP-binding protein|uniref:ATP-binding cassette domain-containing protein n=1 Tax=Paenibacillus TaxID=44249 RepID=UPI000BA02868|nr:MULTISPECIES: ABC transporter ATP-binding protein [Paenibacillus]OZQ71366.1 multidrug ABC transporter ATP-binding protein [Paenibacillus taichungensis]HBU83720.1 ABC transporter ATP-binding protein [Paenibacillus sp.]
MIQIEQVTYSYQETPVLNNVTLHESEPTISAMWGRNGAGKTTLMSLLAGHNRPDAGTIQVMGQDPYNNLAAQENLCYIQENHPLGRNWTINDMVRFGQYFHPQWDQTFAEQLIDMFELPVKKKITKFSKGMKTAAQMILGLASNARVTILDEPTNGLDAEKRKYFYNALLETYEDNPRLILISSHHIEEIQPLCESLIVLQAGKVLLNQPMEEMREKGVLLTGGMDDIKRVTADVEVIESSQMGSTMRVMIDEPYSKVWKDIAHEQGLSIEKATLQDYLINRTRNQEGVKR